MPFCGGVAAAPVYAVTAPSASSVVYGVPTQVALPPTSLVICSPAYPE